MLLAFVVCAASTIEAFSQQVQQPTFRGRVDLVQVDVVVLDADGRPITDLRAEDFTLLDRGEPQPIELFRAVAHERLPKPEFPETSASTSLTTSLQPPIGSSSSSSTISTSRARLMK